MATSTSAVVVAGTTSLATAPPDEPALVQRITALLVNGQPTIAAENRVGLVVTREERPRADRTVGGPALCPGFPRVARVVLTVYCVVELVCCIVGLCVAAAPPTYNSYWYYASAHVRILSYAKFVYTFFICRSLFVLVVLLPILGRVADIGFAAAVFYAGMNMAYAVSLYYVSAFSGLLWGGAPAAYSAPLITLAVVSFTLPGLLGLITAYTPGHAVNQHLVVQTVPDDTDVFVVGDVNAHYPKTTAFTS